MNDTLIKFSGPVEAVSGGSKSDFVSQMVAKFMAGDGTLEQAFKETKMERVAEQAQGLLNGAKFAFSNVGGDGAALQNVTNVAQSSGGISV